MAGKESVTVHLGDGVYYLPETLRFTPKDSGTTANSVIYRATNEGKAILSGGSQLELSWQPFRDGIFKAKTPQNLTIDQLFINGENQRMARYPNYDATKKSDPYQGYAADAFSKERVLSAASWSGFRGFFDLGFN